MFRDTLLVFAVVPFAYNIVVIVAAGRSFRKNALVPAGGSQDFTPPVSILKPIYGLDHEAYENFAKPHPSIEAKDGAPGPSRGLSSVA